MTDEGQSGGSELVPTDVLDQVEKALRESYHAALTLGAAARGVALAAAD